MPNKIEKSKVPFNPCHNCRRLYHTGKDMLRCGVSGLSFRQSYQFISPCREINRKQREYNERPVERARSVFDSPSRY